jgi:hypothetical protein
MEGMTFFSSFFADFGTRQPLSRLCLEVVVHTLQPAQLEQLHAEFLKLDATSSGEISLADFHVVLHHFISKEEIDDMFEKIDYDHSGMVNYHEFLAASISRSDIKEENLRLAFESISNHQEFFTKDDISNLLGMDAQEQEVSSSISFIFFILNMISNCPCVCFFQIDLILQSSALSPNARIDFPTVSDELFGSFICSDVCSV